MKEPCEHMLALAALAGVLRLRIYSEHGEEPAGWVNIHCYRCGAVCETDILKTVPAEQERNRREPNG